MGVHTGEPSLTDEGYIGLAVHQAARIAAAGHGGQVVVSETTCALLDGEFELRDLGEHRLKDIAGPVRLFQLGRDQFPPLRSLSQGRLPLDAPPLLGRKRELGDLLRLLGHERARLVTLTGPGGIGKTSLAIAAAAELVESFDDGVGLVELAAIREPSLVLAQIAETLGGEGDAAGQLGNRELLLILDNLEQVIDAAPDIAGLLVAAPNLSLVVTSREPLRIADEKGVPAPAARGGASGRALPPARGGRPSRVHRRVRPSGRDLPAAGQPPAGDRAGGGPGQGPPSR